MTGLAITNSQITQSLQASMFNDFIAFIDRGEKTTQTYITNLKQFIAWLKYKDITNPVRADIISYRDYLSTEHEAIALDQNSIKGWSYRTDKSGSRIVVKCKANTIAQYLRSVCQFFKWTAANNLYPNIAECIHAPKINASEHKKEALTASEVLIIEHNLITKCEQKTLAAAAASKDTAGRISRSTEQGKRLYAMYLLSVNAGLRTIEISRADIKDLEIKGGTAYLYIWGKGHSEADQRKVLAPEVYKAIKEYIDARTDSKTGNSPLFIGTGNRSGGKRIAVTTISKMLKGVMVDAGYKSDRLTAHSLRHTAGTNTMNITNDLYATQKYMRHANPATTEIYLHCDTEKQEANIAQQLYNLYHGIQESRSSRLEDLINKLKPEQLEQLTNIAAAMAN